MKWDKKDQLWHTEIEVPEKVAKKMLRCPLCGGDFGIENGVMQVSYASQKDWINLLPDELLRLVWVVCDSCGKSIPFSIFPDEVKGFLEASLIPTKVLYTTPVMGRVENRSGWNIDVGILQLFKLAHSRKVKGIDFICGQCGKKNHFRSVDERSKLFQCLECGSFNNFVQ